MFKSILLPQGSAVSSKKSSKRKLGKLFDKDSKVCNILISLAYCYILDACSTIPQYNNQPFSRDF